MVLLSLQIPNYKPELLKLRVKAVLQTTVGHNVRLRIESVTVRQSL